MLQQIDFHSHHYIWCTFDPVGGCVTVSAGGCVPVHDVSAQTPRLPGKWCSFPWADVLCLRNSQTNPANRPNTCQGLDSFQPVASPKSGVLARERRIRTRRLRLLFAALVVQTFIQKTQRHHVCFLQETDCPRLTPATDHCFVQSECGLINQWRGQVVDK